MILLPSVNVIAKDYRYGLRHSLALTAAVLDTGGFRVRAMTDAEVNSWKPGEVERSRDKPRDFNIFMESFYPKLFEFGRKQIFMPNQEWFEPEEVPYLKEIDAVLAKTHHAVEIFSRLGCRTEYVGFTSRDCRLREPSLPMQREFLCINGRNSIGPRVLDVWARHPHWPRLTITTDDSVPEVKAPNIRHFREFLPDRDIAEIQNRHLFHLCVSRAEGFGHKLNEGMSCGAIVIATDAPPMNELVRPDRGMLVGYQSSEPLGVGAAFDFDERDLERTVERCLALSPAEAAGLSSRARTWFEENDRAFRARFTRILRRLAEP